MKEQELTLNEYQRKAMTTCLPSCNNFAYMALNLQAEVGEFMGKVAKAIRKKQVSIGGIDQSELNKFNYQRFELTIQGANELDKELQKEAGDILWQLSGLCVIMGWRLDDIAQQNLDKLASRKERGVIDGNGDNR